MLKYIENSHHENICNKDIQALDHIVSSVRQREEVSIRFMHTIFKEACLIRETTEKTARIYIDDMREMGASDDLIRQKLIDRFEFSPQTAKELMESVTTNA